MRPWSAEGITTVIPNVAVGSCASRGKQTAARHVRNILRIFFRGGVNGDAGFRLPYIEGLFFGGKMIQRFLTACAGVALAAALAQASSIVSDGGFETPAISSGVTAYTTN